MRGWDCGAATGSAPNGGGSGVLDEVTLSAAAPAPAGIGARASRRSADDGSVARQLVPLRQQSVTGVRVTFPENHN